MVKKVIFQEFLKCIPSFFQGEPGSPGTPGGPGDPGTPVTLNI
jgi:hypothetical protein